MDPPPSLSTQELCLRIPRVQLAATCNLKTTYQQSPQFISRSILTGAPKSRWPRAMSAVEPSDRCKTLTSSLSLISSWSCLNKPNPQWRFSSKWQRLPNWTTLNRSTLPKTKCRQSPTGTITWSRFWIIEKILQRTIKPWQPGGPTGPWSPLSLGPERRRKSPCHPTYWLRTISLTPLSTNFRLSKWSNGDKRWRIWWTRIRPSNSTLTDLNGSH